MADLSARVYALCAPALSQLKRRSERDPAQQATVVAAARRLLRELEPIKDRPGVEPVHQRLQSSLSGVPIAPSHDLNRAVSGSLLSVCTIYDLTHFSSLC
jgi:hypothetical protein